MNVINKRRRGELSQDVVTSIAEGLVQRVPELAAEATENIARALRELLAGEDELSRGLRTKMQHYLIEVAESLGRPAAQTMLSTAAAAELMQCSRPYVAMLIDHKKLTGATVTAGGHRRVPESSVREWIAQQTTEAGQDDYRHAAEQGGMYDIPETAFIETEPRQR